MVSDITNTVLVSIVMPAYNAADFISEAIHSVIAQTYQHWELIVIDDGSVDDTATIVNDIKNKDERVTYHYQTNKGLGAARNAALRQAAGSWICFLDADDIWNPDKLTIQIAYAYANPNVDVIFSQGQYLYQSDNELKDYNSLIGLYNSTTMYRQLMGHNHIPALSIFFKRSLIKSTGFQDTNPIIKGCEDWDHWLRMCNTNASFYGMPERLFKYRVHPEAMSANRAGMYMAGTYVLAKNYKSSLLNGEPGAVTRNRLVAALPLILKNIFRAKSTNAIGNYSKLLIKVFAISGYLLPGFVWRKVLHKTNLSER